MKERQTILTLDVDWAPDFMIRAAAEILKKHHVKATWFVTHTSPAIEELKQCPLFECGIHPNFQAGSTHGSTPAKVIRHCLDLVPGAISMRTHGLVQSSHLYFQVMTETPVRVDVSTFHPVNGPSEGSLFWRRGAPPLLKLPYVWEDDFEFESPTPKWDGRSWLEKRRGLNILGFHPVHIFLNSPDERPYFALKKLGPDFLQRTPEEVVALRHEGPGTGNFFTEVVTFLGARPAEQFTIGEYADHCFAENIP